MTERRKGSEDSEVRGFKWILCSLFRRPLGLLNALTRFLFFLLCAGALSAAQPLPGRPAPARAVTFGARLGLVYDDNPFQYSPQDESTFIYHAREGQNPQRFASVRSLDDLVAEIGLAATWRPQIVKRHTTRLDLAVDGRQYVSNSVKSYASIDFAARQFFRRGGYLEASYLFLPYYLIRNYHNLSGTGWSSCAFAEHLGELKVGWQATSWIGVAPFVHYEADVYQAPFQPYDTKALRGGAEISVSPLNLLSGHVSYEYKMAQAQGPSPDISYRQHDGDVKLQLLEPRPVPPGLGSGAWSLELGYHWCWRGYTTTREEDSTHAGRVDVLNQVTGQLRVRLMRSLSAVADVSREWRNSTAPFRSDIDEVKNYAEIRIGVGLKYGGG